MAFVPKQLPSVQWLPGEGEAARHFDLVNRKAMPVPPLKTLERSTAMLEAVLVRRAIANLQHNSNQTGSAMPAASDGPFFRPFL